MIAFRCMYAKGMNRAFPKDTFVVNASTSRQCIPRRGWPWTCTGAKGVCAKLSTGKGVQNFPKNLNGSESRANSCILAPPDEL